MNAFIDESGSVHLKSRYLSRFFIIGVVMPKNITKLLKSYKIFVRKNMSELRRIDKNSKMFDKNGMFRELKGACFDRNMKIRFLDFFCDKDNVNVGYIILDNNKLDERFISNKARTFNYLLKLYFEKMLQWKYIKIEELNLNIDERNVKTESKFSLEDYLNQELILNMNLLKNVKARYYDSSKNKLIQIADVFSNIMYSNIETHGAYNHKINELTKKGIILPIFRFPK